MSGRNVAIITTYNRCGMLEKCIASLREQQGAVCDILVVDNASTDGTAEYLCKEQGLTVLRMAENTGGAGGFYTGMKLAYERGYDRFWLMDDDVVPAKDALARLLAAEAKLDGNYGFLYSETLWTDYLLCEMNRPKLKRGAVEKDGLIPVSQASFVSVLFPAQVVSKVGLPIPEFFVWGDDVEYTRRIAVREGLPCYWVHDSRVIHAMKQNTGSSIALDVPERIERYVYAFRNERYLFRQEGVRGQMFYLLKCVLNAGRIAVMGRGEKKRRFCALWKGMREGKRFNPQIRFADEGRRKSSDQGIRETAR